MRMRSNIDIDIDVYCDEMKFKKIESQIRILSRLNQMEEEYTYFLMNWNILEKYYMDRKSDANLYELSYSYSISEDDTIETSCIEVINYIYELCKIEKNYDLLKLCEMHFCKYVDKDLLEEGK